VRSLRGMIDQLELALVGGGWSTGWSAVWFRTRFPGYGAAGGVEGTTAEILCIAGELRGEEDGSEH